MRFFERAESPHAYTSLLDYRLRAKSILPSLLFDFLEGGSFDEATIKSNSEDLKRIQLKRRVLKDVSKIDMETDLLGDKLAFPLILAPVGFAGVYARRGEVQAAKAAQEAGVPFCLSTVSICPVEEVAENSRAPWFQFYLFKERTHSLELLERAEAAGCSKLLFTADLPIKGARHRYERSKSKSSLWHLLDTLFHPRWLIDVRLKGRPLSLGHAPAFKDLAAGRRWMGNQLSCQSTWKDLEWLRDHWKGRLIVKGILDPEDACLALKSGADGIVVSNHGGRHVDSTLSTAAALPPISQAIQGRIPVLFDGGISSGLDIVKALALGADACMIGKPWMWGLASFGEAGVKDILSILKSELRIAMTHLGASSLKELKRELILNFPSNA